MATWTRAVLQSARQSEIRERFVSTRPWVLEIDVQTQSPSRSPQIVKTLRGVYAVEALGTFQLDERHIFQGVRSGASPADFDETSKTALGLIMASAEADACVISF
jgi:hypothetical protein